MSQITIKLYPFYITEGNTSLVDAVLNGLFGSNKVLPEDIIGSVAIEVLDESGVNLDERPLVLIPGFVDFAKKLLKIHPNFGYVAEIHGNEFYRHALLAAAGDMSAIQKGEQGIIVAQGEPYLALATGELEKFQEFAATRSNACETTRVCHLNDLKQYLLFQEITI